MLITCVECKMTVSDKAVACPHCGYPMQKAKYIKDKPYKMRKLPNGFGSIRHYSGNRSKHYFAYPPVKAWNDNGRPIYEKTLGGFDTWEEAYQCLIEYNKNPFDNSQGGMTFKEVYELFYNDKFMLNKRKYSKSAMNSSNSAFNNFSVLHDKIYRDLRKADFQKVVDECTLKHASVEIMVALIKQMGKFALANDIVDKDYAQYVRNNAIEDDESGVPFTEEEIEILWKNNDSDVIKIALVMMYTGFRLGELRTVKVDKENDVLIGGLKTENGRNRIVPIHPLIKPYLGLIPFPYTNNTYRNYFTEKLTYLGIATAKGGEKRTPHDLRHTFSWLADKYGMDKLAKHLIMGHSTKALGIEDSVYGHRTIDELKSEIYKIQR